MKFAGHLHVIGAVILPMEQQVELTTSAVFVATGANRSSCGISWERGRDSNMDRVAFCSGPLVVIGNPYTAQIEAVFVGHAPESQVNAVRWINDGTRRLLSCDSLGFLNFWNYEGPEYSLESSIAAHSESIGHLSSLALPSGDFLAATAASDKCVRVWKNTKLFQTIDCRVLPLCSALCLYNDRIFLAIGGVDARIVIYRLEDDLFKQVAALEGHADWIRDLDWAVGVSDECVLASASLDRNIRIWSFSDAEQRPRLDVTLEAVLDGHDHSVMNAKWGPDHSLYSTSFDKTVMSWRLEDDKWVSMSQTGEVGGHNLACYAVAFSPDASMILTNTYNGAFYLWAQDDRGLWHSKTVWSGHCSAVAGIVWDVDGDYIVSIGEEDQTTRVYAPWLKSPRAPSLSFHEISRPQVHGYDMACICTVPGVQHRFVSAGQEKVLRVFDAPKPFLRDLHDLSGVVLCKDEMSRAEGVYLPPLSLSNKIMKERERILTDVVVPPEESLLALDSLWPEVAKLYGHGNHLFSVCASHSGAWLASASTSRDRHNAAIIIWRCSTWKEEQRLLNHDLTVIQMAFSGDDQYLLSISRDRSVCVSVHGADGWRRSHKIKNAHTRVIWSCAWNSDDSYFVTGGRDKQVQAWALDRTTGTFSQVGAFTLSTAVTAVAFTSGDLLAVGGEDGRIELWQSMACGSQWRHLHTLPTSMTHSGTVKQVCWQPKKMGQYPLLATCGTDHTVRLFSIENKL